MHKNQKLRFIQEISFMLELSQPAISTVLQFYRKFNQAVTQGQYANQIVVCSCIFLASKIFQDERKIRDILNAIYSAIKLYTLSRSQQSQQATNYINLENLFDKNNNSQSKNQQILSHIQPSYQLTMYNELKRQVLQAEQLLLRILKFDFSIAQQKSSNFKQLLGVCDQLRLPRNIIQIAINVYNDLEFCENVVQWVPGLIYFAVQVSTVQAQMIQEQSLKTHSQKIKEQEINLEKTQNKTQQNQIHSNKSLNLDQKIPQNITKSTPEDLELIQIKKKSNDPSIKIEWQKLFLVPLKKLQVYSEKIISYYQKLSIEEYEDEEQAIKQTIQSNQ